MHSEKVKIDQCIVHALYARVSETMPLYDILNEFQKGHSHMAVVIRHQGETQQPAGEHSTDGKFCF